MQSDGKILIGGAFTALGTDDPMSTRNRIARLNADGTIDDDFAVVDVNGEVFAIAVQSNDDILFAGDFNMVDTTTRNGIARVDTNGNLDMEFDPNATGVTTDSGVANVRAVTLQANGQILIGGLFTQVGGVDQSFLARLNPDGNLDDSFTTTVDNDTQGTLSINAIVLTPNNQIVFTGVGFTSVNGLALGNVVRLNSNGDVDTTFNSPDVAISDIFGGAVNSLALQADGKMLIGGVFLTVNNETRHFIARLNIDGSVDPTFNPAVKDGINNVESIVVQPDGKVLIGGFFDDISGAQMTAHFARLNSDGSLDTSFTPDVSDTVETIVLQPADDNILIGGIFTSIDNGLTRNRIARLENTVPPPEVNIATNAVVLPEGNEGQRAFNFDVSLSFSSNRPSSVQYTVSAGATQPSADANDFANAEFATGTLEFPVGAPTQTISVMVAGDTVTEEDETFTLTLSNPNNATLGASISAQSTIVDDEDDILCLPIPASNGNFAVICL